MVDPEGFEPSTSKVQTLRSPVGARGPCGIPDRIRTGTRRFRKPLLVLLSFGDMEEAA